MPLQGRHSPASAPGSSPPTWPASPTAAARRAPSGGGPPRSAATTRWPATSHRPTTRAQGRAARHPPHHRRGQGGQGAGDRGSDEADGRAVSRHADRQAGPALLCLGFAGAFRRSELCALEVEDLAEMADGLRMLIRRSKGDQEGQGRRSRSSGLPPPPGRGGAGVARRGRDQHGAGAPGSCPGWQGVCRAAGGRQRGADREAVCPSESGSIPRPMPATACAVGSSLVGRGERRESSSNSARSVDTKVARHAARLCPRGSICSRSTREPRSSKREHARGIPHVP